MLCILRFSRLLKENCKIYLYYNATTPIVKEVVDAMLPFIYGNFGNPASSHDLGIAEKQFRQQN